VIRTASAATRVARFWNPTRIEFGFGAVDRVSEHLPAGPIVVVTSPGSTRRGLTGRVADQIGSNRVTVVDDVRPNPDSRDLVRQLDAIPFEVAGVVALGGGSALDTGKVLAALACACQDADPMAVLESAVAGRPVEVGRTLPIICVPTTAGTGAEVTPFATVWDAAAMKKRSIAGPGLFPAAALVDPDLTLSLPESVTVDTGLDALSQGLEAYWNRNAGPVTDAFALGAVRLALATLEPLIQSLNSPDLRSRMAQASLLAGLAISGTRTAVAHSISYPLTLRFGIPHGLACGFTLPALLEYNAEGGHPRMSELPTLLGVESLGALANRLRRLLSILDVGTRIRQYGFDPEKIRDLGPEMITPGRADNNIRDVDGEQAVMIALTSWEQIDGSQS
jgi:alcohol dehydrogenase